MYHEDELIPFLHDKPRIRFWKIFIAAFITACIVIVNVFGLSYRFKHPDMTETQLFLNFFEWFV